VGVGVATSLATGLAQKVVGIDTAPAVPRPASAAPPRGVPLVTAAAAAVEDPDQDIWVAERPVTLSPAQTRMIDDDRQQGGRQGRLDGYLRDMTALGAVKTTAVALDLNLSTQAPGQVRIDRIRVESQCRAPLAGTVFYSPPAGPAEAIGKIGFTAFRCLRPDLRPGHAIAVPEVRRVRPGVRRRRGEPGRPGQVGRQGSGDLYGLIMPGYARRMARPSIFEYAGGSPAFLALATAHHERCLRDPVLNHPFSHPGHPQHVERLGSYWAEVFGGPAVYSEAAGGHSAMLAVHAAQGAEEDLGRRFVACFVQAIDDAGLPEDPDFRAALRSYMESAVAEVMAYSPRGSTVPPALPTPRWSWNGRQTLD
jgi:hemoglobin